MKEVVVINGSRTAIGAYGDTLQSTPLVDLVANVLKATLKKRACGRLPAASVSNLLQTLFATRG